MSEKIGHCYARNNVLISLLSCVTFSMLLLTQSAGAQINVSRGENSLQIITEPILFNTKLADTILESIEIFPSNSAYNEDISTRPVAANSSAIISGKYTNTFGYNLDMGYVIVPPKQKKVAVEIYQYPEESDPGPYPLPDNAPIENWPIFDSDPRSDHSSISGRTNESLDAIQRSGNGDRHVLVLDPYAKKLYEFYAAYKTDTGWRASQATIFDLTSNRMRPQGWTSTDAAGLSVFAATVRYSDVKAGIVPHVIRVTVKKSKNEFVYPATHAASKLNDVDLPRMGERFRLKKDVNISKFSPDARAIAEGMKKYGLIVADNGGSRGMDWMISITPDHRFKGLEDLFNLKPSDFEVIVPTGPHEYGR